MCLYSILLLHIFTAWRLLLRKFSVVAVLVVLVFRRGFVVFVTSFRFMESGYDLAQLAREAQIRWLKPPEVFFILQNCNDQQLSSNVPHKPPGGSLFLYNKRVIKSFRKDGHSWRKRTDQRTAREAHERLKVGNVEALSCYYAHGEENPNLCRRCFWMLDPAYEHIVLVQYREVVQARQETGRQWKFDDDLVNETTNVLRNDMFIQHHQHVRPKIEQGAQPEGIQDEAACSSTSGLNQALWHQLSFDDDYLVDVTSVTHNKNADTTDCLLPFGTGDAVGAPTSQQIDDMVMQLRQHLGSKIEQVAQFEGPEIEQGAQFKGIRDEVTIQALQKIKKQMSLDDSSVGETSVPHNENADTTDSLLPFGTGDPLRAPICQQIGSASFFPQGVITSEFPELGNLVCGDDDDLLEMPPCERSADSIATPKLKFSIHEISPEWCYTSEGSKIIIVGSFLTETTENPWACMIGETEVPVQIIQPGVICCHAPPHLQGIVDICITSGNRGCCSEVRKFEYRTKPEAYLCDPPPETESSTGLNEPFLLLRLVEMLLCDDVRGDVGVDSVDIWNNAIDSLRDGTLISSTSIIDWILQELVKDKLKAWLSFRSQVNDHGNGCFLSKKERGIIHLISGLGFEWALQPILDSGVHVNFRDDNGWTALHWAASFGREKMVAALLATGASAGAVTDPNSEDPKGKTPADVAAASGHRGLAGYLSESALKSHLSSLTGQRDDRFKAAERLSDGGSGGLSDGTGDGDASLKHTLSAVRNAAQAAAQIQAAFRSYSLSRRRQREAAELYRRDECSGLLENVLQGFSSPHRNTREHLAAIAIQKKYRGWKRRKEFVAFRQKVIKIQAHFRAYRDRKKQYRICLAVRVLKIIRRWRRRGSDRCSLSGLGNGSDDDDDDDDILKDFRKRYVEVPIDEAVSNVLSMVESPGARQQYLRVLQAEAEIERLSGGH